MGLIFLINANDPPLFAPFIYSEYYGGHYALVFADDLLLPGEERLHFRCIVAPLGLACRGILLLRRLGTLELLVRNMTTIVTWLIAALESAAGSLPERCGKPSRGPKQSGQVGRQMRHLTVGQVGRQMRHLIPSWLVAAMGRQPTT